MPVVSHMGFSYHPDVDFVPALRLDASQEKAGAGLRTDFRIVNELGIASVRKLNSVWLTEPSHSAANPSHTRTDFAPISTALQALIDH